MVSAALVTACAADQPAALPAAGGAPPGTTRATCEVRSGHGPVTVAVDLPAGFSAGDRRCTWTRTVRGRPEPGGAGEVADEEVSLVAADDGLDSVRDAQAPYAVDEGESYGDDAVLHLRLDEDVPTYGGVAGDRVGWDCFCDGQESTVRMVQADGVRLTWRSAWWRVAATEAELATALSHAGTVPDAGSVG
ncbi:MAG: hypothetical protein CMH83_12550 [Nocardioides sp.]|nr:hypothetical protein [Nocardioides sp.]